MRENSTKKLGPVFNATLGLVLTQKPPNLGPFFYSTAFIYRQKKYMASSPIGLHKTFCPGSEWNAFFEESHFVICLSLLVAKCGRHCGESAFCPKHPTKTVFWGNNTLTVLKQGEVEYLECDVLRAADMLTMLNMLNALGGLGGFPPETFNIFNFPLFRAFVFENALETRGTAKCFECNALRTGDMLSMFDMLNVLGKGFRWVSTQTIQQIQQTFR